MLEIIKELDDIFISLFFIAMSLVTLHVIFGD